MPTWTKPSSANLYRYARLYYAKWDTAELLSKRLRAVIRLIAMEERAQELGVGAIPPALMLTLRLMSGYKDATSRRYYKKAGSHDRRLETEQPKEDGQP